MLELLHFFIQAIQPFLVPICLVSAWALILLFSWSIWSAIRDTATRSHQLHQIPCSNCQYFTSSYHLKCTVHPTEALTEEAINCPDYAEKTSIYHPKDVQNSQR